MERIFSSAEKVRVVLDDGFHGLYHERVRNQSLASFLLQTLGQFAPVLGPENIFFYKQRILTPNFRLMCKETNPKRCTSMSISYLDAESSGRLEKKMQDRLFYANFCEMNQMMHDAARAAVGEQNNIRQPMNELHVTQAVQ